MSRWFWRFLTLAGAVGLVGYLAWEGWQAFGPRRPEMSALRKRVADELIPRVAEDLRQGRGEVRSAILVHLVNDPTDYVSDQLRATLERSGILDVHDLPLDEKLERALKLRVDSTDDFNRAVSWARGRGAQGVLYGKVNVHESSAEGARLEMDVALVALSTREVVFKKSYQHTLSTSPLNTAALQDEMKRVGGPQRFLGWVAAVLLLPVFTVGFIRAMVRKDSNRANAFTLGLYTVIDALLAYLLVGASLTSWTAVLLLLVMAGLAFGYNVFIMSFALKLES